MKEGQPDQSINTWQGVIGRWKREVIPEEHNTPQSEFDRGLEEVEELRTELERHDGSPLSSMRVGMEAVDVIIRMIGVIDALGMDTERLIDAKVDQIHRKYNMQQNADLRANGMPWDQAMAHQKVLWEKNGSNGHKP